NRSNTLLLNDIPSKIVEIRELIAILDRPVDQVLIESRIVIATDDFSHELGARFGLSGLTGDDTYFSGGLEENEVHYGRVGESRIANAGLIRDWIIADDGSPPPVTTFPIPTRGLNVDLPVTNPAGSLALSILNAGYLLDLELSALE